MFLNWFKEEKEYQDDFFNVIPRLSSSLPVIAGGAALHLYTGGSIKDSRDVDIFFDTTPKAKKFIKNLNKRLSKEERLTYKDLGWKEDTRFGANNSEEDYICSKTIEVMGYDINFILQTALKNKKYKCRNLLNSFDFTVCQVATNGTEFMLGDRTAEDIKDKRLSFINLDEKIEFVTNNTIKQTGYYNTVQTIVRSSEHKLESVLHRIQKYKNKGFQPDECMLQFVLKYG